MHALSDKDADGIVDDLHHRYSDIADRDDVEAAVAGARAALESVSKHPEFLAILVEKPLASTAAGLIRSPGALPAERTSMSPPERTRVYAAAIWERPALWTQT